MPDAKAKKKPKKKSAAPEGRDDGALGWIDAGDGYRVALEAGLPELVSAIGLVERLRRGHVAALPVDPALVCSSMSRATPKNQRSSPTVAAGRFKTCTWLLRLEDRHEAHPRPAEVPGRDAVRGELEVRRGIGFRVPPRGGLEATGAEPLRPADAERSRGQRHSHPRS